MNKIVLIGFPGVGKTTIARKLAKILNYHFVDLDQDFETHYKTDISVFIHKYGEQNFRKCEYERLQSLLLSFPDENVIISTGGGTPCFFDAIEMINKYALSVYVKMTEKSLFIRLIHAKKRRPLLQNMNEEELKEYIHKTLSVREKFYEQAAITMKGEDADVPELANLIKKRVSERN